MICRVGHKHACAAVTITEMVVASALLAAAVMPILKAMNVAQATSRKVEVKTCSLTLAQAKLAQCRARAAHDYNTSLAESHTVISGSYLVTVTDDGDATCKTVAVCVGFDENNNGSLDADEVSVTLNSAIAKR